MYFFGTFSFETRDLSLTCDGQPVKLEPQPAKVLAKLLERSGQIVTREELCEAVWQKKTFVEYEQGLNYCLRKVRQALGDSSSNPRFIETLPKQGYRFIETVTNPAAKPAAELQLPLGRHPWFFGIAAASALIILIGVFWSSRRSSQLTSVSSIAIVPFVNRTGTPDVDSPADGLTEGLIRALSETGFLKVFGRTTMFGFRGQESHAREAGRSLKADVIVAGRLDRAGQEVALDVEISKVGDGTILFTHRYLPGPGSWMQVQADLVRDTLTALGADPTARGPGLISPPTLSEDAYRAYTAGQNVSRHLDPTALLAAESLFRRAVQLDPNFSLAWSELASDNLYMGIYFDDPKKWMPRAREAAAQASRLNASLPEPKVTAALVNLLYDWKIPEANAGLSTPLLGKLAVSSFSCASHLLDQTGKSRRAEEQVADALIMDPRSPALVSELGCVSYYKGEYESSIHHFQDALRLDPQSAVAFWGMGRAFSMQGKYAEALSFLDKFPSQDRQEPPILTSERGFAAASMGDRQTALRCLEKLRAVPSGGYVDSYLLATVYLGLKEPDNAFLWLNRAIDEKSAFVISVLTDPHWENVRNDPRFTRTIRRIGLFSA